MHHLKLTPAAINVMRRAVEKPEFVRSSAFTRSPEATPMLLGSF